MQPSRLTFFSVMLAEAGWPVELPTLQALVTVSVAEHPLGGGAAWNPIDTILPKPGATPYNTFGAQNSYHVWNYVSMEQGIQATIDTIAAWPLVEPLIASGTATAEAVCHGFDSSDGVGGGLYLHDLPWVLRFWSGYSATPIPGPGPVIEEITTMLVVRLTGTTGPCWLLEPAPKPGLFQRRGPLTEAQLAEAAGPNGFGIPIRNYTQAQLTVAPVV
jgi:hypothetical protein